VVIPCLNPDGVEIAVKGQAGAGDRGEIIGGLCGGDFSGWQANANGVDLNHNFDAGWGLLRAMEEQAGILGPGPGRYGGPSPGSEPESKAAATFCLTYQPRTLYAFHSQGEEIYYRYGEHTPARSKLMAQILASSSGYAVAQPEGLAAHGGLKDWFIDRFHRPGFTIEIGKGKNPLDVRALQKTYAKLEEMLMIATLL
jgi:g-D-glutamyl-meso-diaminopimelate peptidase